MKTLIAALMLLAPLTAFARDPWTWQDTALEAGFQGLEVADWLTTRDIVWHQQHFPHPAPKHWTATHQETNAILGKNPTYASVNAYCASVMLLHAGISYAIPDSRWRHAWQAMTIVVEFGAVHTNVQAGLSFRF